MDIEVTIFGRLRELAGVSKETVSAAGAMSLSSLISRLEETHGSSFARELAATKGLRILVNGREYQLLGGMETELRDRDLVVLLPPIEAG